MSKREDSVTPSRRNFLKLAAVAAPAAAAATALSGTAVKAVEVQENSNGLQDTAHTRAYFESTKF